MSNQPDFTQMTKEEVIAYFTSKMADEASNKAAEENRSGQVILSLKQQLSQTEQKLEIANADNKKLTDYKINSESLIKNILDSIKENAQIYSRFIHDDFTPLNDIYNFKELNMYVEDILSTLFSAVSADMRHMERSLNLGTSEKNKGLSPLPDYSADDRAQADADAEGEDIIAEAKIEDNPPEDDIPPAAEVALGTVADTQECSSSPDNDDTLKFISDAVMSGCTSSNTTLSSELKEQTLLLKNVELELKNDCSSLNDSRRKERDVSFISVNDGETVAGVVRHAGDKTFKAYCTKCQTIRVFNIVASRKRITPVLTPIDSLGNLGKVLAPVQNAQCPVCKLTFEVNPASMVNIESIDKIRSEETSQDNSCILSGASLDTDKTSKTASESQTSAKDSGSQSNVGTDEKHTAPLIKTSERQKDLRAQFSKIAKSPDGTATEQVIEDILENLGRSTIPVINPVKFNAAVFGKTPAFVKSKVSTALLAILGTELTALGAPKNRLFNRYEGQGLTLSREQLTVLINANARAYIHPVCELIRKDIIKSSPAIIMDESTLYVRETANRKIKEGKSRKSQIWTLNTGWTAPFKASWYSVSDSRSADNVISILGEEVKDNDILKYLISDGYTGYDSALKTLKTMGVEITSCRCFTHARRPLHYLLKNNGLLDIYNRELLPKGALFSDFEENLKKYRNSEQGKSLTDRYASLLTIYYLINALFVIDSAVVRKHQFICNTEEFKADLLDARTRHSAKILDSIFNCIRILIAKNPNVMKCRIAKDGQVLFSKNKRSPISGALIYLIKYEKNLREFIKSADIELTSSAAERSLKLGICSRHSFMFIQSEDGAKAFADYQTIVNTCILNRVSVQHYLLWLTANIKVRINMKIAEGKDDPTFYTMPGKKDKLVDPKEKKFVTLNMYHKENKYGTDSIDMSGLTPYDYRHYLEKLLA